jgi:hypothetical protein
LAGDWGTTCSETSEWWDTGGAAAGAALFAARQRGQSCAGRSLAAAGADSAGAPNEQACSAAACTRGCTTACSNSKSASQAFVRFTYFSIIEYWCGRTLFSVIARTSVRAQLREPDWCRDVAQCSTICGNAGFDCRQQYDNRPIFISINIAKARPGADNRRVVLSFSRISYSLLARCAEHDCIQKLNRIECKSGAVCKTTTGTNSAARSP